MSKSGKKPEGSDTHVAKADVRHKYEVTELADFTRRETKSDGTDVLMPRVAVLTPVDGGKQVRAYVPGNLGEPLALGCIVMCRPARTERQERRPSGQVPGHECPGGPQPAERGRRGAHCDTERAPRDRRGRTGDSG